MFFFTIELRYLLIKENPTHGKPEILNVSNGLTNPFQRLFCKVPR